MIAGLSTIPRTLISTVMLLSMGLLGCGKSIAPSESLQPLTPVAADANAGSWKMILLTGPTQVPVAAPAATNDPTYLAELSAIRAAQASVNADQQAAITYWSAGGVLRWNEIMRELVARQDLPPVPNPDGSYPSPNPANPFANPQYPFSNPPYAARAYSYVSIAQFEALKAAWYYKFQYNRPSPYKSDSTIKNLMPATGVPSYPSEDAVEAAVNDTLLKLLFPTNAAELDADAAAQRQAALVSGRASASDIAAGTALGNSVAAIFAARAANDGMKNAAGNAAIWASLYNNTVAKGQIAWISLETPPRPPMLPLFGQVLGWMMSPVDIANTRPGPPPSTSSPQMASDLNAVHNAVENITPDQLATVYKWADGVSTPTPPGHWNFIAVPYIVAAQMSEVRAARVFALLDMAMHDAAVSCWDTKYAYFNPRPSQLDPTIKTWTGLPNFPSYISGHSIFSSAASDVLSYLFPSGASYFQAQAQEAAMSRLYGGLHYPTDINVGLVQGQHVAAFTLSFAKADGAN
jgi:membrane-associated phospholipid phosphatase